MGNFTDFFSSGSGSNLLEIVQYIPDGRTFEGVSTNYTTPSMTSTLTTTTSYQTITPSVISYVPPSGTKYVRYEYNTKQSNINAYSGITHYKFYIDDVEVSAAWKNFSAQYYSSYGYAVFPIVLAYTLDLTASSDDIANGKISNWTSAKTLKWMCRGYNGTYDGAVLDQNYWRDGTGPAGAPYNFTYPLLTIYAYS